MANLNADEMELVKAAQAALGDAKKAAQDAIDALDIVFAKMRRLSKINRDAGRVTPANAAMRMQGAAAEARGRIDTANGILIQAHGHASDALAAAYDDGGVIVIQGGGGR